MGFESGTLSTVIRRPRLLVEAVRAWFAMSSRPGFGPSPVYLEWRHYTAYGDASATASAHDLVKYLEWRREMRAIRKGEWGA